MHIRRLTEEDYASALELFFALDQLHADGRPDWFRQRDKGEIFPQVHFEAGVKDPDCLFLGAFDDGGQMIGIVRATLWQESGMIQGLKNVCLDNIYVIPSFRNRGVASQLYGQVEQWAAQQQAKRIELHVWDFNREALTAYTAWGMKPQRYVLEKEVTCHETDGN